MVTRFFLLNVLIFIPLVWCGGIKLTFQVEPKTEECVYEKMAATEEFNMQFEVVRGGLLDIKLRINDPNDQIVNEKMAFFNKPENAVDAGTVKFVSAIAGVHKICFDNTMSRWTAKVVSFIIKPKEDATTKPKLATTEHLGTLVDSVIKVADQLSNIEQLQHVHRVIAQSERDRAEKRNSRVMWLSILESFILVSISVFQLRYIKQWFSDKNMPGRV